MLLTNYSTSLFCALYYYKILPLSRGIHDNNLPVLYRQVYFSTSLESQIKKIGLFKSNKMILPAEATRSMNKLTSNMSETQNRKIMKHEKHECNWM